MESHVLSVVRDAMVAVVVISAPAAIAALVVGLVVSVCQTATQIQEQTLSFLPKLLAVMAALVVAGPWMLGQLVRLATRMIELLVESASW
jgi:flagellar biosynthetic protein FliQ